MISQDISIFVGLAFAHLLAVASPGPERLSSAEACHAFTLHRLHVVRRAPPPSRFFRRGRPRGRVVERDVG